MVPQFVGVEKFPRRSGLVINFIDNGDGRGVRLVFGCVFSDGCLKYSPEDKGLSNGVRYVVDIV